MSLFQSVMGDAFGRLALPVQRFHSLGGRVALHGRVSTDAPSSRLAHLLAVCLGAPREATQGVIRFELEAEAGRETWMRHFPRQVMRSQLRRDGAFLCESLGPVRLRFRLVERNGALLMQLAAMDILRLPCPRWLRPTVHAVETGRDGALHFDVRAAWPVLGTVSAYRGHLLLPGQEEQP